MKIALVDAFPNRPKTAEREFIRRSQWALERLGWSGHWVVTSDEIMELRPDVVVATHEFTPKVTPFPTVGLMWSPPIFFRDDPNRVRAFRSYDGYLSGSDHVTEFLEDHLFAMTKQAPIAGPFLPTCHATDYTGPLPVNGLFYVGANWDGNRHGGLFQSLEARLPLHVHGPRDRWTGLRQSYQGELPFDGDAVLDAIRRSGVALCLNRKDHNDAGLPSARLFEAAAAGAVAIVDPLPVIREAFGDSVFYMPEDPAEDRVEAIAALWDRIQSNPARAQEMAAEAHRVFTEQFSLEKLYGGLLPDLVERIRDTGGWTPRPMTKPTPAATPTEADEEFPTVEYIVRIGGRPVEVVRRCLQSLADQTWPSMAVLLVRYRDVPGLDALLDEFRARFRWLTVVDQQPLNGLRSTTLWYGLKRVTAPYFANQDDDDTMHPTHVASVMDTLRRHPDRLFAYSGTIRVEEEDGHYVMQENFGGELQEVVKERRELKFLHPYDRRELYLGYNSIQSNSWIAHRDVLREDTLVDPRYEVGEDVYLYMLFSRVTDFAPSWRPTIEWNWRSSSRDNSMFQQEKWNYIGYRTRVRLQYDLEQPAMSTYAAQVTELQASRWRQWGLRLGLAKPASFEHDAPKPFWKRR